MKLINLQVPVQEHALLTANFAKSRQDFAKNVYLHIFKKIQMEIAS